MQRARVTALPREDGERHIYSVSELTRSIRLALESTFGLVVVQGEVSGYKGPNRSSGHHYFTLKDASSVIQVILYSDWATRECREILKDGMTLQVEGELTVYEKSGQYQIKALRLRPVGYGALQARFDALRRKLELEGLFAEGRKRPLPRYPTRIGIVTSETGAAVQDMLRILRARAPYATIVVADTRVQGEGAARDIASAIARMNARGDVEVLIVGRGGGSLEDLWAFNEEAVVRAVVNSRLPVIVAVGHETDTTLADFAADVRAATPTHAAQLVVRDIEEIRATLETMRTHARRRLLARLEHARTRLRGAENHHALREPGRRIGQERQTLDRFHEKLTGSLREWVAVRRTALERHTTQLRAHEPSRTFAHARDRIDALRRSALQAMRTGLERRGERVRSQWRLLSSFDHHKVLERGYALVWSGGASALLKRGMDLRPGDPIEVQFFDARAEARVTDVAPGRETS